jgi:hypothetical protein
MANEEFSTSETEQLRRLFQEAALNDFPNPNRVGCPTDKGILKSIATRTLPLADPAWRHAARCSPCFREVKAFEAETKLAFRGGRAGGVIAALILIATALFFLRDRLSPRGPANYQSATLDLRSYTTSRGEGEKPADGKPPVTLDRGRLTVAVLLPVGADAGHYEYKLLNDGLQTVLSGAGEAKIENHSTTLATKLDTDKLPSGHYSLWMRQPGFDWRSYQINIVSTP